VSQDREEGKKNRTTNFLPPTLSKIMRRRRPRLAMEMYLSLVGSAISKRKRTKSSESQRHNAVKRLTREKEMRGRGGKGAHHEISRAEA
jgi:hypothetical protein